MALSIIFHAGSSYLTILPACLLGVCLTAHALDGRAWPSPIAASEGPSIPPSIPRVTSLFPAEVSHIIGEPLNSVTSRGNGPGPPRKPNRVSDVDYLQKARLEAPHVDRLLSAAVASRAGYPPAARGGSFPLLFEGTSKPEQLNLLANRTRTAAGSGWEDQLASLWSELHKGLAEGEPIGVPLNPTTASLGGARLQPSGAPHLVEAASNFGVEEAQRESLAETVPPVSPSKGQLQTKEPLPPPAAREQQTQGEKQTEPSRLPQERLAEAQQQPLQQQEQQTQGEQLQPQQPQHNQFREQPTEQQHSQKQPAEQQRNVMSSSSEPAAGSKEGGAARPEGSTGAPTAGGEGWGGGLLGHSVVALAGSLALLLVTGALAATGGTGGGAVFLAILLGALKLKIKEAVPLSKASLRLCQLLLPVLPPLASAALLRLLLVMVCCSALAGTYVHRKREVREGLAAVDEMWVNLLVPMALSGTLVGVVLNSVSPPTLLLPLLLLVLGALCCRALLSAAQMYQQEEEMRAAAGFDIISVPFEGRLPAGWRQDRSLPRQATHASSASEADTHHGHDTSSSRSSLLLRGEATHGHSPPRGLRRAPSLPDDSRLTSPWEKAHSSSSARDVELQQQQQEEQQQPPCQQQEQQRERSHRQHEQQHEQQRGQPLWQEQRPQREQQQQPDISSPYVLSLPHASSLEGLEAPLFVSLAAEDSLLHTTHISAFAATTSDYEDLDSSGFTGASAAAPSLRFGRGWWKRARGLLTSGNGEGPLREADAADCGPGQHGQPRGPLEDYLMDLPADSTGKEDDSERPLEQQYEQPSLMQDQQQQGCLAWRVAATAARMRRDAAAACRRLLQSSPVREPQYHLLLPLLLLVVCCSRRWKLAAVAAAVAAAAGAALQAFVSFALLLVGGVSRSCGGVQQEAAAAARPLLVCIRQLQQAAAGGGASSRVPGGSLLSGGGPSGGSVEMEDLSSSGTQEGGASHLLTHACPPAPPAASWWCCTPETAAARRAATAGEEAEELLLALLVAPCVGLITGTLAGLVGIGGGLLEPAVAVGTSSACVVYTSLATSLQFLLLGRLYVLPCLLFGSTAAAAAAVGCSSLHAVRRLLAGRRSFVGGLVAAAILLATLMTVKRYLREEPV
ncbi:hypothetical protein Efla_001663 [Eimeria flavescens]